MTEPEKPATAEGSLISHLLELRDRLLYAVIAIAVVFFALIPFAGDVYTLVAQPLMGVLPPGATMVASAPPPGPGSSGSPSWRSPGYGPAWL